LIAFDIKRALIYYITKDITINLLIFTINGGVFMQMERILIQLPKNLKAKLDALKTQGYSVSGFVRALLEKEFSKTKKKGA